MLLPSSAAFCIRKFVIAAAVILAGTGVTSHAALAQDNGDAVALQVRWHDTLGDEALYAPLFLFSFHDGELDVFDHGQPASELLAGVLPQMVSPSRLGQHANVLQEMFPDLLFDTLVSYPHSAGVLDPAPPGFSLFQQANVTLDPTRHRFLSYVGRLQPSDDAFFGNADPFEIELFDEQGRFNGPFYLDVFGNQVLDAGLCANNETQLQWLDWRTAEPAEPVCSDGEGTVRIHPGLNGSLRNPDGAPQRILGGTLAASGPRPARTYDPVDADFSRPGHKLGRLVINRPNAARWTPTGSWYSPDHAGEGFNIEVVEPEDGAGPPRILVYWYTFEPGEGGRQVWLSGIADLPESHWGDWSPVDLIVSEGGRFASTDNPDLVERQPWGRIELRFSSCSQGRVRYQPAGAQWPAGEYPIFRLSPQIEGLGWLCRPEDANLVLPVSQTD